MVKYLLSTENRITKSIIQRSRIQGQSQSSKSKSSVQIPVYTVQCTKSSVQSPVYKVQCTIFCVHGPVYNNRERNKKNHRMKKGRLNNLCTDVFEGSFFVGPPVYIQLKSAVYLYLIKNLNFVASPSATKIHRIHFLICFIFSPQFVNRNLGALDGEGGGWGRIIKVYSFHLWY